MASWYDYESKIRSYEKTYNEKENTEILNMIVDKLTSKFNITLNEKGE